MKIAIIGPGAIGCLLAGLLSKSKHQVVLIDHVKERAATLTAQGIAVEGVAGTWVSKVQVIEDIKGVQGVDLVIMCVKSYDTKQAITCYKSLVSAQTQVLTLQNGIGNIEAIGEVVGPEKVIGGVTNLGATLLGAGSVKFAGKGETVIGRIDGKIPVEMRSVRELFNGAGLKMSICRDIKGLLWSKLIVNVGINALTAVVRVHNGKLVEFEGTRKIMREAVTEAVRIAKRKRIKLLYDDPLAKVEAVCEATAANVSSMLQDVLKGKRTEIEYINGVVVRFAQELGIDVPVNTMLVDLVKTIESSYGVAI